MDYPISSIQEADNQLLRRILFALRNNGAVGMAPANASNLLLRQILYAIQNQTGGSSSNAGGGTNSAGGVVTLVAGSKTVPAPTITANSRILLTVQSLGTVATPTPVAVTSRIAGNSFTITSSSAVDTSVIAYEIFEP